MSIRKVYVPGAERWVTLGQYVRAIKLAIARPDATFPHGLTCWWSCTGADVVAQFREGMHARINEAVPYHRRGYADAPQA